MSVLRPRQPGERTAYADKVRAWLYDYLGNCCAECGALAPLEIDHPYGRAWTPRRVNRYDRHLRYKREALAGDVRLLCADCNSVIRPRRRVAVAAADTPF